MEDITIFKLNRYSLVSAFHEKSAGKGEESVKLVNQEP